MTLSCQLLMNAEEVDHKPIFDLLYWAREHDPHGDWIQPGYDMMGTNQSILDLGMLAGDLNTIFSNIVADDSLSEHPPPDIRSWLGDQMEKKIDLVWICW